MRRPAALLAVAVLGVATILGIVVFLGNRPSPVAEATTPTGSKPSSTEPAAPALSDLDPSRVDGTSAAPKREPSATAGTPVEAVAKAPNGVLLVRVLAKKTGAPVPGVQIFVAIKDQEPFDQRPTTGEDGRAELDVPSGADLTIFTDSPGKDIEPVWLDVPALHPSERREIVLSPIVGDDLRFFGKVLADDGSTPIQAAHATLATVSYARSPHASITARVRTVLSRATAGPDGIFELSLASWKEPHVRVEADGYSLQVLRNLADHDTPDRARPIRMTRSASLAARVVDARGGAIAGTTVELSAQGFLLPPKERPIVDIPDETWKETVGEDGRCVVTGLVPGVALKVEIRRNGELLFREPDPLVVQAGETVEREWILGGGCDLHGLVVDASEKPVPDLAIWLAPRRSTAAKYFQPNEEQTTTAQTKTDAEGRFVLKSVPAGTWLIGPAPVTPPPPDGVAAVATEIEVSSAPSQDVTLRVHLGLFIRGKVVGVDGEPVPECSVISTSAALDWGPQCRPDPKGEFVLGPLDAGKHSLVAEAMGRYGPSDAVEAEAGAQDVVLKLKPGGALDIRVVDRNTGEPCTAELAFSLEKPGMRPFGSGFGVSTKPDGTLAWRGLEAGTWGISARTADGRFGVASGIRVVGGTEPGAVQIDVSPGGVLQILYEGKAPFARVGLKLDGLWIDWGKNVRPGEVVRMGSPAGAVTLEIRIGAGGEPKSKVVQLGPGETKVIALNDEDG